MVDTLISNRSNLQRIKTMKVLCEFLPCLNSSLENIKFQIVSKSLGLQDSFLSLFFRSCFFFALFFARAHERAKFVDYVNPTGMEALDEIYEFVQILYSSPAISRP